MEKKPEIANELSCLTILPQYSEDQNILRMTGFYAQFRG